jgi:hypothetical protein
MLPLRCVLAPLLSLSLIFCSVPTVYAARPPLGVLTIASHAHLDESVAFPGLSVFDGERLSTDAEGQLGVRAGRSTIALAAKTDVTLIQMGGGMHVDMAAGSLYFSVPENEAIEVHVEEAMLRPDSTQPTQARVSIFAPKVLQITAVHGGLNFNYHEEFQNLPEGQTYRIYLDSPAEPQIAAGSGAGKSSFGSKVAYFIVGAGLAAIAVWQIRDHTSSGSAPDRGGRRKLSVLSFQF